MKVLHLLWPYWRCEWWLDIVSEIWLTKNIWRSISNNILSVPVWLCRNAERIFPRHCWVRSVPLNLLHKPLCSNLAQSTAAKFHELYRQALNPFLCSWSPTVIQADAIKKCLFMRLLTSKTFHQTNWHLLQGYLLSVMCLRSFPFQSFSPPNHS